MDLSAPGERSQIKTALCRNAQDSAKSKGGDLMPKLKDMLGIESVVEKTVSGMKTDLYKSIKEVAEMRYRILEIETKLSNLEATVKLMVVKP